MTQVLNVAVRLLGSADAAAYRALRLRMLLLHPDAFTSSYEEDVCQPLEWTQSRITYTPWTPDSFVLGAFEADDSLIGAVGIKREVRRKQAHKAILFGMFVAPEHGRRGVGKALLQACVTRCRQAAGLLQIHLTVTADNQPANALYATAGFRVYGVEPRAVMVDGVGYSKRQMVLALDARLL